MKVKPPPKPYMLVPSFKGLIQLQIQNILLKRKTILKALNTQKTLSELSSAEIQTMTKDFYLNYEANGLRASFPLNYLSNYAILSSDCVFLACQSG